MHHLKVGLTCIALLTSGCTTQIEHDFTTPDMGLISVPLENVEPVGYSIEPPVSAMQSDAEPAFAKVTIIDEVVQSASEDSVADAAPADQSGRLLEEAAAAELAGDFAIMMDRLNEAASQGSAPAHYALAKHYSAGTAVQRDLLKSEVHLGEAASLGHPEAIRVEGWKLLRGDDRPKNLQAGVAKLEQAAETSPRAMRELGLLNLGLSEPNLHNPSKGLALLERAQAAGDADASFYLSRQLEMDGDKDSAAAAIETAVARRSARALAYVGEQKARAGQFDEGAALLREAATLGDAQAMFAYAGMIQTGKVASEDRPFDAVLWLSLAAERQHMQAKKELSLHEGTIKQDELASPGRLEREKASLNEEIRRAKLLAEKG